MYFSKNAIYNSNPIHRTQLILWNLESFIDNNYLKISSWHCTFLNPPQRIFTPRSWRLFPPKFNSLRLEDLSPRIVASGSQQSIVKPHWLKLKRNIVHFTSDMFKCINKSSFFTKLTLTSWSWCCGSSAQERGALAPCLWEHYFSSPALSDMRGLI